MAENVKVNYWEALTICTNINPPGSFSLCTTREVQANLCDEQGCNLDNHLFWAERYPSKKKTKTIFDTNL